MRNLLVTALLGLSACGGTPGNQAAAQPGQTGAQVTPSAPGQPPANATAATPATGAGRCRDAQGHFARCATTSAGAPAATPATPALPAGIVRDPNGRCRSAQGRFVTCPR